MDAVVELGRNIVSKHQIQPEYGDEQAAAGRDCRTCLGRPNSQARTRTGKYSRLYMDGWRDGLNRLWQDGVTILPRPAKKVATAKNNRPVPALEKKKKHRPVPSGQKKKKKPPRPASEKKQTAPSRLGKKKQPPRPASKKTKKRPVLP